MADLYLPEPPVPESDPYLASNARAAIASAATLLPAIGHSRSFLIDPMLRYGGGGPQWRWPVPWPAAKEDLAADLLEAERALNRGGYCGPDDRGALFHTVLCLFLPDGRTQAFEGRMEGQFAPLTAERRKSRDFSADFADCFVPDRGDGAIARLDGLMSKWVEDQKQAINALRRAVLSS